MIKRVSILTLLGLVIGGVVGVLAAGFVEAVLWLNDLFYVSRQSRTLVSNPAWLTAMTIGIPTAGGLIVVGLLSTMMPGNRFHGPSDAVRTAQSLDATMPVKSGVLFTRGACVSRKELRNQDDTTGKADHTLTELKGSAVPYAEPEPLMLSPDTSIWSAMSEMEDFVGESIPVLEDGRLVGVLFESTIVSAYLNILENIRREENAAV